MEKSAFQNGPPILNDALLFEASLENPERFEDPRIWVPGSVYEDGKETYTREELIKAGVEIDFREESSSGLPVEEQKRIYKQRQYEDRLNINGVVCHPDGTPMTPTQESLRYAKAAENNGATAAIMCYEPIYPVQRPSLPDISSQESLIPISINAKANQRRRIEKLYESPPNSPSVELTGISSSERVYQREKYIDPVNEKQSYEAELFQKVIQRMFILNCRNTIYAFDPAEHYFRPCSDMDLGRMINGLYGDEILRRGHLEKTYSSVCKLIRMESSIFCEKLPESPWWIWPFQDGLHDIRNGRVCQHSLDKFYTYCLKCNYDPSASCP